jgi:hypothetical protein
MDIDQVPLPYTYGSLYFIPVDSHYSERVRSVVAYSVDEPLIQDVRMATHVAGANQQSAWPNE